MSAPTCERGGCDRSTVARGLCRKHYERERDRHRHRDDKIVPNRARHRVVAELIRRHRAEFDTIYTEKLTEAQAEHARLAEIAAEHNAQPTADRQVVRLRTGPAPDDQEIEDRIATGNPGPIRCTTCAGFHEAGHRCLACAQNSTVPGQQTSQSDGRARQAAPQRVARPRITGRQAVEFRIEQLLRKGRSAQWVAANLGEPMPVVMRVLGRIRQGAAS